MLGVQAADESPGQARPEQGPGTWGGYVPHHLVQGGRRASTSLSFGATPRASSVVYDRANSAISMIKPGEVNWKKVFEGAPHFHMSGITPALSASAADVTREALKAAKEAGCSVSFDLNYRAKLWSQEEAGRCLSPMMDSVDILITTEEDTFKVFGIKEETYEKVAGKVGGEV